MTRSDGSALSTEKAMENQWREGMTAVAVLASAVGTVVLTPSLVAQRPPVRLASQSVGSPEIRSTAGLRPDESLLFNGWGVTPAGRHVATTDMPLKMAVSPDGQTLALVHGGFNEEGLTLIDV